MTSNHRSKPDVYLDNSDAVYDYYLRHRPNRLRALAAYALLGNRFRPRMVFPDGTRERLADLLRSKRPILFAVNHLSQSDPYVVAAAAWRSPLRALIGSVGVLAKDELFLEPRRRRRVDMMGGIPVFRGKDHGIRAVNAAGQRMMDICAQRLAAGDHVAVFPEGTCNDVDPGRVQAIGSGIGHIAFRAAKLGSPPALLCMGISYGTRPDPRVEPTGDEVRSAACYFRAPLLTLPQRPGDIARVTGAELQLAVDGAMNAY